MNSGKRPSDNLREEVSRPRRRPPPDHRTPVHVAEELVAEAEHCASLWSPKLLGVQGGKKKEEMAGRIGPLRELLEELPPLGAVDLSQQDCVHIKNIIRKKDFEMGMQALVDMIINCVDLAAYLRVELFGAVGNTPSLQLLLQVYRIDTPSDLCKRIADGTGAQVDVRIIRKCFGPHCACHDLSVEKVFPGMIKDLKQRNLPNLPYISTSKEAGSGALGVLGSLSAMNINDSIGKPTAEVQRFLQNQKGKEFEEVMSTVGMLIFGCQDGKAVRRLVQCQKVVCNHRHFGNSFLGGKKQKPRPDLCRVLQIVSILTLGGLVFESFMKNFSELHDEADHDEEEYKSCAPKMLRKIHFAVYSVCRVPESERNVSRPYAHCFLHNYRVSAFTQYMVQLKYGRQETHPVNSSSA